MRTLSDYICKRCGLPLTACWRGRGALTLGWKHASNGGYGKPEARFRHEPEPHRRPHDDSAEIAAMLRDRHKETP